MHAPLGTFIRSASAVVPLAALWLVFSAAAVAQQASATGPFATFSGSWLGSGSITLANGGTERLRCEAAYQVADRGHVLHQNLRCTSDSYNFTLRTSVEHEGGAITGRWIEDTRDATGSISGRASGGQVQAVVQGPAFSAALSLSARGNRQSVEIRSEQSDMRRVSIDLRRASR